MSDELRADVNESGGVFFSLVCECEPCVNRRTKRMYFFPRDCSFCGAEQYCRKLSAPYEEAVYSCWSCYKAMNHDEVRHG
jgi:hypothetical protein